MSDAWGHISRRVQYEDRGHSTRCWIWTGPLHEHGYGRTSVPGIGPRVRIHRATYEYFKGPIPDGLVIDHLCRVRACCNPDHLEPVTIAENTARGVSGTRRVCEHGTGYRMPNGRCRVCRNAYMRAWMARNQAKNIERCRAYRAANRQALKMGKQTARAIGQSVS